ncbi:MAG: ferrochelatase [Bdellovibrionia bacterium]
MTIQPTHHQPAHSNHARGVLLINLGTPDGEPIHGPSAEQVKVYLRQFLMDRFVVDIPFVFRWLLVNGIILRTRPEQSAEAYRKIWTENGSPLLHYHLKLSEGVAERLSKDLGIEPDKIQPAMRYGSPSIPAALQILSDLGVNEVLLVPLYPQYSLAATESSLVECKEWAAKNAPSMKFSEFPAFYEDEPFIDAFAQVARDSLQGYDYDHLLFSFHGLPERHVRKTDRSGGNHCLKKSDCCAQITDANRDCYRAQCYATARALAKKLGLSSDQYTVCFQSRLGRTPWIRPYTDIVYQELAARGVKKVAVMCPAFVADCLETLEEIQIRGREQYIQLGGEDLKLVPSLNDSPFWMDGLSKMIKARLEGAPL